MPWYAQMIARSARNRKVAKTKLVTITTMVVPITSSRVGKVTFPSRQEVVGTTGVVLVTSVIFALYLWGVDVVILKVYQWLMDMAGKMTGTVVG